MSTGRPYGAIYTRQLLPAVAKEVIKMAGDTKGGVAILATSFLLRMTVCQGRVKASYV